MAIGIENYPNIDTSNPSDYPDGRLKDNPGNRTGTPINRLTNGDLHQFFAKLLRDSGIEANGLPENEYSGHQYIEALLNRIENYNEFENEGNTPNDGSQVTILTVPRPAGKTSILTVTMIAQVVSGVISSEGSCVREVKAGYLASGTIIDSAEVIINKTTGSTNPTFQVLLSGGNWLIRANSGSGTIYKCKAKVKVMSVG